MKNDTHKFTDTDIHILECGLGWIKEAEDAFADKLVHRLWREHPEATTSLHSMDLPPFSRYIVQFLDTIIGELRSYGKIRFPIGEQWLNLLPTPVSHLEPEQFVGIAETYLAILSEVAEDAWSPAMESAWRKMIHEVSIAMWGQQPEASSLLRISSPFQFINKRKNRMSQQLFVFFLGSVMILAGGIATVGLWSRSRLAEVKLQRKPSFKKGWCS